VIEQKSFIYFKNIPKNVQSSELNEIYKILLNQWYNRQDATYLNNNTLSHFKKFDKICLFYIYLLI